MEWMGATRVHGQNLRLYGRVFDSTTEKPIELAIISALSLSDSLVTGALTKANGDFILENLPPQLLQVRIQFLGFETQVITINPASNGNQPDLGNIRLKPDRKLLQEVVVEAEKAQVMIGIDRRIYQVDKDLSARGGSALDAIKNIPGLTVSSDNVVQLRNQAPAIFVDGRPTLLTLDQIPADEIDRIEVITNPSSKYVADATGGILNVILKKNLKPGFNGMLNLGLGTNQRTNLNGNLSIREKKFSAQLSGNYNTALNRNNGTSNRELFSNSIFSGSFNQLNTNKTFRWNATGRINVDYRINVRSLLSASYNYTENEIDTDERQEFSASNASSMPTAGGYRLTNLNNGWKVHQFQLVFRKTFPKPGKELSSDLMGIQSQNKNAAGFETYNTYNQTIPGTSEEFQQNSGNRLARLITWQLDYVNPLTENSKLEWGSRIAYKRSASDFEVLLFDPVSDETLVDSGLSNTFTVNDFIGAAYVNYAGKWKGINYQAGLRFENTWFVAQSVTTGERFSYIYPTSLKELDKVLFPAVYFSKKVADHSEFQLNFSRKTGRPGYIQLIPFVTYADRQNVQIGNPVLGPEFINLAEFNYSYMAGKGNILSGLYMRQTLHSITTVVYPSEIDPDILISTFGNGRNKLEYGWESTVKRKLTDWLDFMVNGNVFYTSISLDQNNALISNKGFSWNVKSMLNVRASKKLGFQLNGSYEATRIIAQGTIQPIYFLDVSMSLNVNKKLSFSATFSDLFNTKRFGTRIVSDTFIQETIRRWETRYLRVNLTWKFGEPDFSFFRKRSNSRRDPGTGGSEIDRKSVV
jgi:hypothetical protein